MRASVFVLVLISASAAAQLAFQSPSPTYDGQQVSTVSLIANPHRDLQTLYRMVTQHSGEPYSQNKIDADAEALQQAGKFPKVEVSVVPEVAGLRVEFLLEPTTWAC
jgi:outer membrane protein assembly factor BamA